MRLAHLLAAVLVAAAACGDIDVQSIRTSNVVPQVLEGEWTGQWQSSRNSGNGSLVLRMQDFEGEPVVSVQLDNPCVEQRDYQFRTAGNRFELLADGVVLFSAVLEADRSLVGSYVCQDDAGVWDATWARELPTLVDLSGRWEGTISAFGVSPVALVLHVQQVVRGGALALDGAAEVPDLLPTALPLTGFLQFHADTFDVSLFTAAGNGPALQLLGVGLTGAKRIDTGLLQANGDPLLPFSQAAWRAQWVSR